MFQKNRSWLGMLTIVGALSLVGCGGGNNNDAEICNDGVDNDGDFLRDCDDQDCAAEVVCQDEVCDNGADDDGDGQVDCDDNDCADDVACLEAIPGDGIRTPQLEECDDGNLVDGDGCSADMTLEDLTTITSNDINGVNPAAATKSVFVPVGGIDFNGDGVVDDAFDLDDDNVADASVLFIISTDRSDICDLFLAFGDIIGFLFNGLFSAAIDGTFALTMVQLSNGQAFTVGDFTGAGGIGNDILSATGAGLDLVDAGWIQIAGGAAAADTTFGSNGVGTLSITEFNLDPNTLAGNLAATSNGIVQTFDFAAGADINEPITVDIQAVSCAVDGL